MWQSLCTLYITFNQLNKEIEEKVKIFQNAGFKLVIISNGEEANMPSHLRKLIQNHI